MDLLERYVAEIRRHLPAAQADDIAAEIEDDLRSQIDDGANVLDAIRAYGNPLVVAARYARVQSLVGPQLFPYYRRSLALAVAAVVAVILIGGILRSLLLGNFAAFSNAVGHAFSSVIYVVGVVTIVFFLIERYGRVPELLTRWNPDRLPGASAVPYSHFQSGIEFAANIGMMLALFTLAGSAHGFASLTFAPVSIADTGIVFTNAWQPAYASLVVASFVVALGALAVYVNPYQTRLRLLSHVIGYIVSICGLGRTLLAGGLVSGALPQLSQWVTLSLTVLMLCVSIAAVADCWQFARTFIPRNRSMLAA